MTPDWKSMTVVAGASAAVAVAPAFLQRFPGGSKNLGQACHDRAEVGDGASGGSIRAASMSPVSTPSPVVPWSSMMTCPDCSPPRE